MSLKIFDIKSTIISKNKSDENWKQHNFIFQKYAHVLFEKIQELGDSYEKILLHSSDNEELFALLNKFKYKKILQISEFKKLVKESKNARSKKIIGPLNSIPIKNKYDLVISNLYLHRVNNIVQFASEIKNLLTRNGVFVCSYFGGKSLIELRESMIKADNEIRDGAYQRVIPYVDMIDACNIFSSSGFKEIVSDKLTFNVKYTNLMKLLKDIKGVGESNCLINRNKGLMTKQFLELSEKYYFSNHATLEKKINATIDIISLVMWNN